MAEELQLADEVLPITESKVTELFLTPFGFGYIRKSIGVISTSYYAYLVSKGNKFRHRGAARLAR